MKIFTKRLALALFFLSVLSTTVFAADHLIPVGKVVGLDLSSGTVTVAAFDDALPAAKEGGIQAGDQILAIDGAKITCAEDVRHALDASKGTVEMTVCRDGVEKTIHIAPHITENGPKLGVFLRQGITGIGTITWYDPDTGAFGTLGHGVSDAKGCLLKMTSGKVYPAKVVSVQRGRAGAPGQLKGAMSGDTLLGSVSRNVQQGVFGTAQNAWEGQAIPTASWEDVRTGDATIRSTVTEGEPRDYSVEILKIYSKRPTDDRNFLIRVTDPELLEATGGIVQGMSGSPIIQDGKLVGAVTHVLVNDPTRGYGIFIENMLDAAGYTKSRGNAPGFLFAVSFCFFVFQVPRQIRQAKHRRNNRNDDEHPQSVVGGQNIQNGWCTFGPGHIEIIGSRNHGIHPCSQRRQTKQCTIGTDHGTECRSHMMNKNHIKNGNIT